jgi:Outer membrane protein beta-barrel domain
MLLKSLFVSLLLFLFTVFIFNTEAEAAGRKRGGRSAFAGGALSFGLGYSFSTAEQDGLNQIISDAKVNNSATTSNLSSASEYVGFVTFTFSNSLVAIQLRPTLFQQSESGNGTAGNYNYDLEGFTFFPLVRLIPLSNDIIDFYIQGGLGYGKLSGEIKNGPTEVSFSGTNFGAQIGLGANFCFWPEHCFGVEGNYRYLPIQRNMITSSNGTLSNNITQVANGSEFEVSGNDVETKLTGISGLLTYTYNF